MIACCVCGCLRLRFVDSVSCVYCLCNYAGCLLVCVFLLTVILFLFVVRSNCLFLFCCVFDVVVVLSVMLFVVRVVVL